MKNEQALIREMNRYIDALDLARDELKRISVCPGVTAEIKQLCERGQSNITQNVPVIDQRDKALAALRALYVEGRWMIPLTEVPLERQVALWEAAKQVLGC